MMTLFWATRVSFFLLAQSILIAVAASLVNTVAGLHDVTQQPLRREMFGLSIAIGAVGLFLALVFWYVFTLNFDNVGVDIDMLKAIDPFYETARSNQAARRHSHWYYRPIFRKKGMNWVVVNVLPVSIVVLWCTVGAFGIAIFLSS
jgi:hypothetical protein